MVEDNAFFELDTPGKQPGLVTTASKAALV
jgi:hypothetical protein